METRESVQERIDYYAEKLSSLKSSNNATATEENDNKRIKKRVLQSLGKLKKKLQEIEEKESSDKLLSSAELELLSKKDHNVVKMTTGQMKMKLKLLNKELAQYAQKKQLKQAIKRFNWGLKKGFLFTIHTYANILNAFIRCGEMEGAENILSEMRENNINHNTVSLTIMIKGYSESGNLFRARQYIEELINQHSLSARSVNAYLRGCLRVGAVKEAAKIVQIMEEQEKERKDKKSNKNSHENENESDDEDIFENDDEETNEEKYLTSLSSSSSLDLSSTTKVYLSTLLCQKFQLSSALELALTLSPGIDLAHIFIRIARTQSFFSNSLTGSNDSGNMISIEKLLDEANESLEKAKSAHVRDAIYSKMMNDQPKQEQIVKKSNKKRNNNETVSKDETKMSFNKEGGRTSEDSNKSSYLFLQHRRGELQSELERIKEFCVLRIGASPILQLYNLFCRISRILYFGYDGKSDLNISNESKSASLSPNECLLIALKEKFGLDNIISYFESCNCSKNNSENEVLKDLGLKLSESLNERINCVLDENGFIQLPLLFKQLLPKSKPSNEESKKKRKKEIADRNEISSLDSSHESLGSVCLELGSGSGEWIACQAAAERENIKNKDPLNNIPKSFWLACELRCDRVYDIFCQNIFSSPLHQLPSSFNLFSSSNSTSKSNLKYSAIENERNIQDNLAILGGNAWFILRDRISKSSIDKVFINHPEPPERSSGGQDNEGKHMLTEECFGLLHNVLKPRGTVTIVTDSEAYANLLVEILKEMAVTNKNSEQEVIAFESVILYKDDSRKLEKEVALFQNKLDKKSINQNNYIINKASDVVKERKELVEQKIEIEPENDKKKLKLENNLELKTLPKSVDAESSDDEDEDDNFVEIIHVKRTNSNPKPALIQKVIDKKRNSDVVVDKQFEDSNKNKKASKIDVEQVVDQNVTNNVFKRDNENVENVSESKIQLWRGDKPGADMGHVAEASSYFDRMWKKGDKKKRWFLYLKKVTV